MAWTMVAEQQLMCPGCGCGVLEVRSGGKAHPCFWDSLAAGVGWDEEGPEEADCLRCSNCTCVFETDQEDEVVAYNLAIEHSSQVS